MRTLRLVWACVAAAAARVVVPAVEYTNGWTQTVGGVEADTLIKFTIVLKEQGLTELKRIANEVSDPTHPKYGEHLSAEQVKVLTQPKVSDVAKVEEWLTAADLNYTFASSSSIEVEGPAEIVGPMLRTRFHIASHKEDGYEVLRAGKYRIPNSVEESITTVLGLHGLPPPKIRSKADENARVKVTPSVLYSTYGVSKEPVRRSHDNRHAVVEFSGRNLNSTDLAAMFKKYVSDYEKGVDDKVSIFHGNGTDASSRADVDTQYMMATAPGIQTEYWVYPDLDFGHELHKWTTTLVETEDIARVHTVGFSIQGNLEDYGISQTVVEAIDANFAKLAARGITIIVASGNFGSGYRPPNQCSAKQAKRKGVVGKVSSSSTVGGMDRCCAKAQEENAEGWQFVRAGTMIDFNTIYDVKVPENPPGAVTFPNQLMNNGDKWYVFGELDQQVGGFVNAKDLNGSLGTIELEFGPGYGKPPYAPPHIFDVWGTFNTTELDAFSEFNSPDPSNIFAWGCPDAVTDLVVCYNWLYPEPAPPTVQAPVPTPAPSPCSLPTIQVAPPTNDYVTVDNVKYDVSTYAPTPPYNPSTGYWQLAGTFVDTDGGELEAQHCDYDGVLEVHFDPLPPFPPPEPPVGGGPAMEYHVFANFTYEDEKYWLNGTAVYNGTTLDYVIWHCPDFTPQINCWVWNLPSEPPTPVVQAPTAAPTPEPTCLTCEIPCIEVAPPDPDWVAVDNVKYDIKIPAERPSPPPPYMPDSGCWVLAGTFVDLDGGELEARHCDYEGFAVLHFEPYSPYPPDPLDPENPAAPSPAPTIGGGPAMEYHVFANFTYNGETHWLQAQALYNGTTLDTLYWRCEGFENENCWVWFVGAPAPCPPPPPPLGSGECTTFSKVHHHTKAPPNTYSGSTNDALGNLWPSWPASSPWVTAVGSTRFEGQAIGDAEVAVDSFGSGGGFSSMYITDHDYQTAAVKQYFKSVDSSSLPPGKMFDRRARATPDVSVLGEGLQMIHNGSVVSVGGTSASAHVFAGFVSLLNEARIANGRKPMGFLNHFLYQHKDAFTDVTGGSNKIGFDGQALPYGYECAEGWDPVTGLGTPLFPKLHEAAMRKRKTERSTDDKSHTTVAAAVAAAVIALTLWTFNMSGPAVETPVVQEPYSVDEPDPKK